MLRRDPDVILIAHRIDPRRRELYVEGTSDKHFVEWLVGDQKPSNVSVIGIDFVDIPLTPRGGNRQRLLDFLEIVDGHGVDIYGLVDSDMALEAVDRKIQGNVWFTDFRDVESYVLSVENLDAALRAGCGLGRPDAVTAYESIVRVARWLAAVRLVSLRQDLDLPVSKGNWIRHIAVRGDGSAEIDRNNVGCALLQAAGVGLSEQARFFADVEAVEAELAELDDRIVVHGKDYMRIFTRQLGQVGVRIDDGGRLLRSTFLKSALHEFPTLAAVCAYLQGS